jgi:DNA repair exonuclease SbcCD ATPase subunit
MIITLGARSNRHADDSRETEQGSKTKNWLNSYDNTCPVCQRDYSEISEESLADHLTLRIAELNSEAKRLQSILATMREASADERRLIARLTDLQQSQLSPEVRFPPGTP